MLRIEEIRTIAVIGAGVMGSGIAQTFAQAGYEVRLQARRQETLRGALERIRKNQRIMVEAGLLDREVARQAKERIRTTTDLAEAVAGCQFVSESVPEEMGVKTETFKALDRLAPPGAILTTNTSGLSVTAIAAATSRPEAVAGFHWLNPPHLMPPVEVIRGAATPDALLELVAELARRIGRIPIRVEKDVPGFLWNRLQLALVREAVHILEEGIAGPDAVDQAVTAGLGLRWAAVGPIRTMDLGGLHTFHAVAGYLYRNLSTASEPQRLLADKVAAGQTGLFAGRGFYSYTAEEAEAALAARDARLIAFLKLGSRPGSDGKGEVKG